MASRVPAQTYLSIDDLDQVEQHAHQLGLSRAAMLRILVRRALHPGVSRSLREGGSRDA